MAAYMLARTGLRVVVLEKEELPRHKSCGGALSWAAVNLLEWDSDQMDQDSIIERRISLIRSLCRYAMPKMVKSPHLILIDRSSFDASLIRRGLSLGKGSVELLEGFRVSNVEEGDMDVTIRGSSGEIVRAKYLIAADGALSRAARSLGLNRDASYGMAIDAEVEIMMEAYDALKDTATFNYFCVEKGYGWIFPKREGRLSCGIVSWDRRYRQHITAAAMRDFLDRSLPSGNLRSVRMYRHPLPFYSGQRCIATRRTCLVGDAASLVDPIMGEGIAYALQSSALAARVISALLGAGLSDEEGLLSPPKLHDRGDCRVYQDLIQSSFGKYLDSLFCFIQPIFLDNPDYFYRKFILMEQNYVSLAERLSRHFKRI